MLKIAKAELSRPHSNVNKSKNALELLNSISKETTVKEDTISTAECSHHITLTDTPNLQDRLNLHYCIDLLYVQYTCKR